VVAIAIVMVIGEAVAPNLVLFLSLPPLIYNAAFFSAPRETRENAVPITALAFGATAVTILAVGAVTTAILPDIGWRPPWHSRRPLRPPARSSPPPCLNGLGPRARKISDEIRRSISRTLDLHQTPPRWPGSPTRAGPARLVTQRGGGNTEQCEH
jgi:hypothetical protein